MDTPNNCLYICTVSVQLLIQNYDKYTYKAMEQKIHKIVRSFAVKKKKAPHNWKEIVAGRMGVEPETVGAYSRGKRGIQNGKMIEALKILNEVIDEHNITIQKLTA